jgi:type II secretory pathway component PulF
MDINKKINKLFGTATIIAIIALVILVVYLAMSAPI